MDSLLRCAHDGLRLASEIQSVFVLGGHPRFAVVVSQSFLLLLNGELDRSQVAAGAVSRNLVRSATFESGWHEV